MDIVTHLVTAHLLQLILMQRGSKLAGARNKSDLWPKYVANSAQICCTQRTNMLHATPDDGMASRGLRSANGCSGCLQDPTCYLLELWTPIWEPPAGKICGYKVPSSTGLQFRRWAKWVYTSQGEGGWKYMLTSILAET